MTDTIYWIWLSLCCGPASRAYAPLIDHFGSPYRVYRASENEILQVHGMTEGLAKKLCSKDLDDAIAVADACAILDIGIVPYGSPQYPLRLKQLRDAPAVLYYRGGWCDFDKNVCIAVVGTRKMSNYGKKSAYTMGADLTVGGAVVVSGMALGVDSMAAAGALDVGGGTVAVLGCGVDIAYPSEHAYLMKKIISKGFVISEYPPGTSPSRRNFPERNRIISGLCQGTLVIEADMRSGSLITARCAAYQGREVFALAGMVGVSNSEGTNHLIKNGARIVTCAEDILELYQFLYPSKINIAAIGQSAHHYSNRRSIDERASSAASKLGIKVAGVSLSAVTNDKSETRSVRVKEKEEQPKEKSSSKSTKISEILGTLDACSARVYSCMPEEESATIDEIIRYGFKVHEVASALTMLEISGLVTALPGGQYIKSKKQ